ncbi:MAG: hypothetical protein ISQ13_02210 [Candidatus Margulisbacteria bacterium]|nr:hypothetical protein [Candidatus Margulisiibacteriota bacterium]
MDNTLKARLIVELLDELKYPVLASLTSQELVKLNGVSLESLSDLSNADIASAMTTFFEAVDARKLAKDEADDLDEPVIEPIAVVKSAPQPLKEDVSPKTTMTLAEKIQTQPPQLLACVLDRVSDEQRSFILDQLPDEKKELIREIKVEKTPISPQVIQLIMDELELTAH